MKPKGFSLIELMVVLVISAIIIGFAVPSFFSLLRDINTKVAMYELLRAIESSRSLAVTSNNRTVLLANQEDWEQGWTLFIDKNHDGELNGEETLKLQKKALNKVKISANTHVEKYISFIGTGEGRKLGPNGSGAFQVGTIKICPDTQGTGYALVISRGGRTRIKTLTTAECTEIN